MSIRNRDILKVQIIFLSFLFFILNVGFVFADDSWNVELISRIDSPTPRNIVVQDDIAYVAADGFLTILDVSNPSEPLLLANFETLHRTFYIDIDGTLVYLLESDYSSNYILSYLRIVDVSQPSQPEQITIYEIPGAPYGIQIANNHVYICTYYHEAAGFYIIDVSEPDIPSQVAYLNPSNRIYIFQVADNYLYTIDENSCLVLYDVSEPENPDSLSHFDIPYDINDMDIADDYVYLALENWPSYFIQIIDVSNSENPEEIALHELPHPITHISVSSGLAYIGISPVIKLCDVSDPLNIVELSFFINESEFSKFYVNNDFIFLIDFWFGISIIDASIPQQPIQVGRYQSLGQVSCAFNYGDLTYIACRGSGLQICDTSNPATPVIMNSYYGSPLANIVYIQGSYAYISTYYTIVDQDPYTFRIIDISQTDEPQEVGSIESLVIRGIQVVGNYAYLACDNPGLCIIDVSDPAQPELISYYPTTTFANGDIHVVGNYAYMASSLDGLFVFDVSDPYWPFLTDSYGSFLEQDFRGVYVADNYVYLADWGFGLRIIDANDPFDLQEVGQFPTEGRSADVQVVFPYAYLTDGEKGLRIIDVSDMENPVEVGYYNTAAFALRVFASNDLLYLADTGAGFYILEHQPTAIDDRLESYGSNAQLMQNFPNPFKRTTSIHFFLSEPGFVWLRLFNSIGQNVSTLIAQNMSAGPHTFNWKAEDMANGIYFYRLKTEKQQITKSLTILK